MKILTVKDDKFFLNDQPFTLLSGAIHYFRVVPEYWRDRLLKLKACGLNTVETYVAWNIHEPQPGQFNFSGMADIVAFIELAAEIGLYVIIRPGPYICAEWDLGGLPAWLLKDPNMKLRSSYQPYLTAVDRFYDQLIPKLAALQSTNGGPILAMQVENEYGSYGNDTKYLSYLKDGLINRGINVPLFTSDGPTDWMLQGGTLTDVLKTANFGSRAKENFAKLLEYQPNLPLVCMEFWIGWFDHWGGPHHTRDATDMANTLRDILASGGHFNFYMFHGGTNFGFYNGANCHDKYQPTITSYDYDALLTEAGDFTEKYYAARQVLEESGHPATVKLPEPIKKINYGQVELTSYSPLFSALPIISQSKYSLHPQSMEMFDQYYGFIHYRTEISGPREKNRLKIHDVRDRAYVFVNQEFQGIIMRSENEQLEIDIPAAGAVLDILVENMGRVNYGNHLHDRKGITHGVSLNGQFLHNWDIFSLPLDNVEKLPFNQTKPAIPGFFKGTFTIEKIGDTFLSLPGWGKGVCFINGFNLGRYWEIGPQKTLYIPGPLLKQGENEVIIFELEKFTTPFVYLQDKPNLG
ncbi:MAG: beta-galactosidase [Firmicutes bacterium]|nr:beta-galactosidase [Bacillota bacterium]